MRDKHDSRRQRTIVDQNVKGETSAPERLDKLPHRFQGSQVHVDKLSCRQKNTVCTNRSMTVLKELYGKQCF